MGSCKRDRKKERKKKTKSGFRAREGKKSYLGGRKKLSVLFTSVSTTNFNIFTIM